MQPAQQAAETKINAKAIVETIREDAAKERVLPMFSIHLYIIRADSMDSCSFSCTSLPRVLDADLVDLVNRIAYVVHDGIDEMIVAV